MKFLSRHTINTCSLKCPQIVSLLSSQFTSRTIYLAKFPSSSAHSSNIMLGLRYQVGPVPPTHGENQIYRHDKWNSFILTSSASSVLFIFIFIIPKREGRTPFVAAGVHCRSVVRESSVRGKDLFRSCVGGREGHDLSGPWTTKNRL